VDILGTIYGYLTGPLVALFLLGSGPIKGFAVTLTLGLLISMFTAIFVSRAIFDAVLSRRARVTRAVGGGMEYTLETPIPEADSRRRSRKPKKSKKSVRSPCVLIVTILEFICVRHLL
jgi:hypothetical protein